MEISADSCEADEQVIGFCRFGQETLDLGIWQTSGFGSAGPSVSMACRIKAGNRDRLSEELVPDSLQHGSTKI